MNLELLMSEPDDGALNRPINRGGMVLLRELIIYKEENYSSIKNVVEFGVGGGGKQVFWANVFEDANTYGIELFHPESDWAKSMNEEMLNWYNQGYICSIGQVEDVDNSTLLHGYDGYDRSTADEMKKYLGNEKLDFIVDDSDPNGNVKQKKRINCHDTWKHLLKEDGFFWNETIMGQGTENSRVLEGTWQNDEFMKEYASKGWIIFDMKKHSNYERLEAPSNSYFGLWAHDLTLYSDVIREYEDCIVRGHENF